MEADLHPAAPVALDLRTLETPPEDEFESCRCVGTTVVPSENRVDLTVFRREVDTLTALRKVWSAAADSRHGVTDPS